MPELPEAETIARELDLRLSGKVLAGVVLSRRDIVHGDVVPLERFLPGRRVMSVARRGKRVIVRLEPACDLVFRLGMTGRLTCENSGRPVARHTHLRVGIKDCGDELRFRDPRRFGGIWVHLGEARFNPDRPNGIDESANSITDELGPEPLDLPASKFRILLSRKRQIKSLLMDQRAIAGLGNIYCDESLHSAGIHPLKASNELTVEQSARLLRSIKATLRKAIRYNGSTLIDYRGADGRRGSFQDHHRVYQRDGMPCRTCGTAIVRIPAAGRSTFYCPRCQPQGERHRA